MSREWTRPQKIDDSAREHAGPPEIDRRVLVLVRDAADAELVRCTVAAEVPAIPCADADELLARLDEGAAVCFCDEAALPEERLGAWMSRQPPWSDLPVVVAARRSAIAPEERPLLRVMERGNLTILQRPLDAATLGAAVRSAVRARERQYEVRDLVTRLSALDQRKDALIAVLGHELRNPLGAAASALGVARSAGCGDDERRRHLAVVDRQLAHLALLVDDLIDLAQVTAGRVDLAPERLELGELVRRVADQPEMARRLADRLHLHDEGPLFVAGDPMRLEQVVAHLLDYALASSPDGDAIWAVLSREGDCAELSIVDDGVGIPEELLPHVFDPFARLSNPLAESHGGLGLGLAVAQRLVERHGGAIEARSEGDGAGTEIIVRLPLAADLRRGDGSPSCGASAADAVAAAGGVPARAASGATDGDDLVEPRITHVRARADAADPPAERTPRRPLEVLVVEDNEDAREALVSLLRIWGCQPTEAADGGRAVEIGQAQRFDLALVDIGLPVIDGYEVAQRLRRERPAGEMLMVAMTGYGQPEDRRRALQAGFDQHLVKPVAPDALSRLVDELAARVGS